MWLRLWVQFISPPFFSHSRVFKIFLCPVKFSNISTLLLKFWKNITCLVKFLVFRPSRWSFCQSPAATVKLIQDVKSSTRKTIGRTIGFVTYFYRDNRIFRAGVRKFPTVIYPSVKTIVTICSISHLNYPYLKLSDLME